jgi:hypothetical protein
MGINKFLSMAHSPVGLPPTLLEKSKNGYLGMNSSLTIVCPFPITVCLGGVSFVDMKGI